MEEEFKVRPSEEFVLDLYANHAMNGIIITLDWKETDDNVDEGTVIDYSQIAESAFDLAEAMILERRKRKDGYKL